MIWQEGLVIVLLFWAYAIAGGFMYCAGFLQAAWANSPSLNLSPSEASLINGIAFTVTLIPAPLVQAVFRRFNIRPWSVLAVTGPVLSASLLMSSYCQTLAQLVFTNGICIAACVMLTILSYFMAIYEYFPDRKIYFYHGLSMGGSGFGILVQSLLYRLIDDWRMVELLNTAAGGLLLVIGLILSPASCRKLGIRRYHQTPNIEESSLIIPKEDTDTIEREISQSKHSSLLSVLKNPPFLILLLMFMFTGMVINVVMTFQFERMNRIGSEDSSTLAFMVCGGIQTIFRPIFGLTNNNGFITPVQMCQLMKILMIIGLVLCNVLSDSFYYQFGFVVSILAIFQASATTTDLLMIKEELSEEDKASGMAWMNMIGGASSIAGILLVGYSYDVTGSFLTSYYCLAGSLAANILLSVYYQSISRSNRRSRPQQE